MKWEEFRAERQRRRLPFVVAHRGVHRLRPENTLTGFDLALEQGAFALETDLHFTKDDEIVLLHDPTVDRTTNGSGYVRDLTLAELRELRTLDPKSKRPTDSPIPTLIELIQHTDRQVPLLLELKDPLFQDRQYARRLIDTLAAMGMQDSCAVVSFKLHHVETVEMLCPAIPSGLITMNNPIPKPNVELLGPIFPLLYANPLYVAWAHRMNSIVCPLDTAPEKRMGYYLRLGVDAVLADDPAAALAAME